MRQFDTISTNNRPLDYIHIAFHINWLEWCGRFGKTKVAVKIWLLRWLFPFLIDSNFVSPVNKRLCWKVSQIWSNSKVYISNYIRFVQLPFTKTVDLMRHFEEDISSKSCLQIPTSSSSAFAKVTISIFPNKNPETTKIQFGTRHFAKIGQGLVWFVELPVSFVSPRSV